MDSNLLLLDWTVLVFYGLSVIAIGYYSKEKESTERDYFLGGRQMPWWSVMISIYATSLSALTFIGVPGAAYTGDFRYLQLGLGDFIGRLLIAFLFLKPFYSKKVTTVYEFLGGRFGPRSHDAGTLFFLVTRLLASGVRLAGCAIALSVVFQVPINLAIIVITLIAVIYTLLGGIKAVIWTDCLQFFLFISAAVIAVLTVIYALPNGWNDFISIGIEHEKFKLFHVSLNPSHHDFIFNFNNPNALVAGMVFGCLSTFAALGTDHDLVQRMLTCKKAKDSQQALIMTALLNVPITLIFLSVGASLFVYYSVFPDDTVIRLLSENQADKIFPYFIKTVLNPGFRGLLIAGLLAAAMSSLDSALNALASSCYIDIIKRYSNATITNETALKITRYLILAFSIILAGIGMKFVQTESILWLGFKIVGYTYGALLGIFLLAVLTENRGRDNINALAMTSSVILVIFLTSDSVFFLTDFRTVLLSPLKITKIAWPWAIGIGTSWTFFTCIFFKNNEENNK